MATVSDAAGAAQNVAIVRHVRTLDADKLASAKDAYNAGLAAEQGKWPSWVAFAQEIGVTASMLNFPTDDELARKAFDGAVDLLIDSFVRDAWTRAALKARGEELKQAQTAGQHAVADQIKREIGAARVRRSELRGVILFGNIVGSYVLNRLAQEGELAGAHKATIWADAIGACRTRVKACQDNSRVITADDLLSAVAATMDGHRKPAKSEDEKQQARIAAFHKLLGQLANDGLIPVRTMKSIRRMVASADARMEMPADAEDKAETKPAAETAPAKPATKGKAKAKAETAPAPAPKADTAKNKASVAADVI